MQHYLSQCFVGRSSAAITLSSRLQLKFAIMSYFLTLCESVSANPSLLILIRLNIIIHNSCNLLIHIGTRHTVLKSYPRTYRRQ